jgi:hypothetical protein
MIEQMHTWAGTIFPVSFKITDLPQALHEAKVILFADDTNILLTDNKLLSLKEKILKVRNQLDNWFHDNHLIINMEKTRVLFLQGRRPTPIYRPIFCLNNKEIIYSSNVKFLSIYITGPPTLNTYAKNSTRLFI